MKNILLGAISASVITFALAAPTQAASVSTTSWTPSSFMNALKARAALAYAPANLKDNFTPGHAAFGANNSSSYSSYNDWLDQYYASQAFKDYYASASSALAPASGSYGSASQQAGSSFGSGAAQGSGSVFRSGSSGAYGTRASGYSHSHALAGGSGSGYSGSRYAGSTSGSGYGHSHGGAIAGHSHSGGSNAYAGSRGLSYGHASGVAGRSVFGAPNVVRGINQGSSHSNSGVFLGGSGGAGYASYAAQYQQYLKQLSAYNAYLANYRNGSISGGSTIVSGPVGGGIVGGGIVGGGTIVSGGTVGGSLVGNGTTVSGSIVGSGTIVSGGAGVIGTGLVNGGYVANGGYLGNGGTAGGIVGGGINGGYLGNGYATTNGSSTTTVTSTTPQITSQANYPYGYNVYGATQTSAVGNNLVTTYPGYNVSGSTTVTTTSLTTPATTATTSGAFAGYVNLFLIGTGTGSIESEVTSTDFLTVEHGIGYGASFAAGGYWNRLIGAMPTGLRSEVEVAYHQGPVSNVNLTSSGDAADPGDSTNILTGMFNTAFDIGSGSLKPYVGAGAGVAKISATHSGAGVPLATIDSTVPAVQAFAGLKFNLTDNIALNAGGKYVHTLKSTSVGTFGSNTDHNIGLYAGQVGMTFSF